MKPETALQAMVRKLDNRDKMSQAGYVTNLPEIKAILDSLTNATPAVVLEQTAHGNDVSVLIKIGFTLERDLL